MEGWWPGRGENHSTNQAGANWSVTSVLPSWNTAALWSVVLRIFFPPLFSHACTDSNLSQLIDLNFFVCLIFVFKSSSFHLQLSTLILAFFQCFQFLPSLRLGNLCFCLHNSNHLRNNVYIPELLTQHRKLGGNILSYITSIASWLGWERKWEYWNTAKETFSWYWWPQCSSQIQNRGKKKQNSPHLAFLIQAMKWAFWKYCLFLKGI